VVRGQDLDESLLSRVAAALPEQPWPTGVHKSVAAELGLSNGTVSDAIQLLIQRGQFRHQVGGRVLDE
jgi:hypothetical protein